MWQVKSAGREPAGRKEKREKQRETLLPEQRKKRTELTRRKTWLT